MNMLLLSSISILELIGALLTEIDVSSAYISCVGIPCLLSFLIDYADNRHM